MSDLGDHAAHRRRVLENPRFVHLVEAEADQRCFLIGSAADRRTIELLIGVPVEQITTVAGGGAACEYLVAKNDNERPAPAYGLLPVEQKGTAPAR